jgi:hypothetical protein
MNNTTVREFGVSENGVHRVKTLVGIGLKRVDAEEITRLEGEVKTAAASDHFTARVAVLRLTGSSEGEAVRRAARELPDNFRAWALLGRQHQKS